MPSEGPRAKQWRFTMTDYTPADLDRLSSPIPGVEYLMFGKEVSASFVRKLEGVVCFEDRKRVGQCTKIIGRAHFVVVSKPIREIIKHCKKQGDFTEWGVLMTSGIRSSMWDRIEQYKKQVADLEKESSNQLSIIEQYEKDRQPLLNRLEAKAVESSNQLSIIEQYKKQVAELESRSQPMLSRLSKWFGL